MNRQRGLVVDFRSDGHRTYVGRQIEQLTGCRYSVLQSTTSLLKYKKVLFATADDALFKVLFFAGVRHLLGKSTSAILYSYKKVLQADHLLFRIKRLLLKACVSSRIIRLYSTYESAELSGAIYFYDFQYYDLLEDTSIPARKKDKISTILFAGKPSAEKEFRLFLRSNLGMSKVACFDKKFLTPEIDQMLKAHNCRFVDGSLESVLIENIGRSRFVWCYYNPIRDQSSGIFGRAFQLGAVPLVRRGSQLELFAIRNSIPHAILTEHGLEMVEGRFDPSNYLLFRKHNENAFRKLFY